LSSLPGPINLRPVKLLKGTPSRFENETIDFVIIRENAEGEYSNSGGRLYSGLDQEIAVQNTIITRAGTAKAARFAFLYAEKHGKRTVTSNKVQCHRSFYETLG
jgi:tartrate dehydrogenase/decarboxylase/D-malate dehydrogenase